MSIITCPHCGTTAPDSKISYVEHSFDFEGGVYGRQTAVYLTIKVLKCSNSDCKKYSFWAMGHNSYLEGLEVNIYPKSSAIQYPEYVPEAIRYDYEEAYEIVDASPKASATLSRRCMQGIIRDFWNIKGKSLYEEITQLKDKIPPDLWRVMDSIRKIGNIGAHMEKDVGLIVDIEPDEAKKLLQVIEFMIKDCYINRHEREKLFTDVVGIDQQKQEIKTT